MHTTPDRQHESSDVHIRPVAIFVASLFVAVVLVLAAMAGLYRYFASHQPQPEISPSPLVQTRQTAPEPRLQSTPSQDFRALRAHEDAVLGSYGWVDRRTGKVRIPINRAIERMVEKW